MKYALISALIPAAAYAVVLPRQFTTEHHSEGSFPTSMSSGMSMPTALPSGGFGQGQGGGRHNGTQNGQGFQPSGSMHVSLTTDVPRVATSMPSMATSITSSGYGSELPTASLLRRQEDDSAPPSGDFSMPTTTDVFPTSSFPYGAAASSAGWPNGQGSFQPSNTVGPSGDQGLPPNFSIPTSFPTTLMKRQSSGNLQSGATAPSGGSSGGHASGSAAPSGTMGGGMGSGFGGHGNGTHPGGSQAHGTGSVGGGAMFTNMPSSLESRMPTSTPRA